MNKLSTERQAQVVRALCEGNSIRSTARMTGVAINTVVKLLTDLGSACLDYQDAAMHDLPCRRIQCDEIWSFVYAKAKNVPAEHEGEFGYGDVWTWTALDADSKLAVSWMVGRRDADTALAFMRDLASRLAQRIQLTTDGLKTYVTAVEDAFGADIDYAMLVKLYGPSPVGGQGRYSPGPCVGAEHQVVRGKPDELVFAIQERIGPLRCQEIGILDPQAYFYDARRLPSWWTGPVPGAHRVLWGKLPPQAMPTAERLRESSLSYLKNELPQQILTDVTNFADAHDPTLPKRVRLLATRVTPTIFALAGHDADDVLEVWALPKFDALRRLEARHPDDPGPGLAREFFEKVRRLYGQQFDPDLGRKTFRIGIGFLRWAERLAESLPEPGDGAREAG